MSSEGKDDIIEKEECGEKFIISEILHFAIVFFCQSGMKKKQKEGLKKRDFHYFSF
jgi:hypothetical protein